MSDQKWNRLGFIITIVLIICHMIVNQISHNEIVVNNAISFKHIGELITATTNANIIAEERYRLVLQRLDYIQEQVEVSHPNELKRKQ